MYRLKFTDHCIDSLWVIKLKGCKQALPPHPPELCWVNHLKGNYINTAISSFLFWHKNVTNYCSKHAKTIYFIFNKTFLSFDFWFLDFFRLGFSRTKENLVSDPDAGIFGKMWQKMHNFSINKILSAHSNYKICRIQNQK